MSKLFKVIAEVKIHLNTKRTWPIKSGYRPGFEFIPDKQTSGSIKLLHEKEILPGRKAEVEVYFISDQLLGNIKAGTKFKFYEGPNEIGDGMIKQVIGWENRESI